MFKRTITRMKDDFVKFLTSDLLITILKVIGIGLLGIIAWLSLGWSIVTVTENSQWWAVSVFGIFFSYFFAVFYLLTYLDLKHEDRWKEIDEKHSKNSEKTE